VGELGRFDLIRIGHEMKQVVTNECAAGRKIVTARKLFLRRGTQQIQSELDGGPPASHVVLEIAEDSFVLQVNFRSQRKKKRVDIEVIEPEGANQPS